MYLYTLYYELMLYMNVQCTLYCVCVLCMSVYIVIHDCVVYKHVCTMYTVYMCMYVLCIKVCVQCTLYTCVMDVVYKRVCTVYTASVCMCVCTLTISAYLLQVEWWGG